MIPTVFEGDLDEEISYRIFGFFVGTSVSVSENDLRNLHFMVMREHFNHEFRFRGCGNQKFSVSMLDALPKDNRITLQHIIYSGIFSGFFLMIPAALVEQPPQSLAERLNRFEKLQELYSEEPPVMPQQDDEFFMHLQRYVSGGKIPQTGMLYEYCALLETLKVFDQAKATTIREREKKRRMYEMSPQGRREKLNEKK